MFNPSLIPEIALVLRRSEYDLHLALRDSQSRLILQRFAAQSDLVGGEGFELIRDAYSVSSLIRGLYHSSIYSSDHVIQHPLRQLLRFTEGAPLGTFAVDREHLLSSIIVNSAGLTERGQRSRLIRWADNVRKARDAHVVSRMPLPAPVGSQTRQLDVESYGYEERQWARLAELVKEAGIRVYPGWRDTLFDLGVPLTLAQGATSVSYFVLTGWAALFTTSAASAATLAASYAWRQHPEKRLGPTLYAGKGRLLELAHYPPGKLLLSEQATT